MTTKTGRRLAGVAMGLVAFLGIIVWVNLAEIKAVLVALHPGYEPPPAEARLEAVFDGADAQRPHIDVSLTPVMDGFTMPTDLAFVPGDASLLVVLEKRGALKWVDVVTGKTGTALRLKVLTDSEMGLLGIAFHPEFQANGRFFLNHNVTSGGVDVTRIQAFTAVPSGGLRQGKVKAGPVLLEVAQPYPNHNGGQLAFGPDGMLYIGLGDGGWRDDPHGHGQNTATLLGSMLRIDVDGGSGEIPYAIPPDNPFAQDNGDAKPEIWAYGLRNPWRYSFAPDGRLVVADVGQNQWEEVAVVGPGENHGWKVREARHCFPPNKSCEGDGLVDPFYEYGRDEGKSITGGRVYTGAAIPALRGLYVFTDFISGRLWAIPLPVPGDDALVEARALGRWPIMVTAFAQDLQGELYLADLGQGRILKMGQPSAAAGP